MLGWVRLGCFFPHGGVTSPLLHTPPCHSSTRVLREDWRDLKLAHACLLRAQTTTAVFRVAPLTFLLACCVSKCWACGGMRAVVLADCVSALYVVVRTFNVITLVVMFFNPFFTNTSCTLHSLNAKLTTVLHQTKYPNFQRQHQGPL